MIRIGLSVLLAGFVWTAQGAEYFETDVQCNVQATEQLLVAAGGTCLSTSDCLPGENCIRGTCQLNGGAGSCLTDMDCALGERCVAGMCRR